MCAGRKAESAIRSGKGPAANPPPIARVSEALARQRRGKRTQSACRTKSNAPSNAAGRCERAQAGKMRICREVPRLKSVRQLPWMGCGVLRRFWIISPLGSLDGLPNQARSNGLQKSFFLSPLPNRNEGREVSATEKGWGAASGCGGARFADGQESSSRQHGPQTRPLCNIPSLYTCMYKLPTGEYPGAFWAEDFSQQQSGTNAIPMDLPSVLNMWLAG